MTYPWPQPESFISGLSCRFLPSHGSAAFSNMIFGPALNLVDFSKPTVMVFSWGILAGIWLLLANVLPISFWNSEDGQYVSDRRILIWTGLLYYLVAMTLIKSFMSKGCAELEIAAEDYLYARKPPVPSTLL